MKRNGRKSINFSDNKNNKCNAHILCRFKAYTHNIYTLSRKYDGGEASRIKKEKNYIGNCLVT